MEEQLKGKLIYGFGDSLVYGHLLEIGMLDYIAEKYGMKYKKYAVNGASVIPGIAEKMNQDITVDDIAEQIRKASETVPDYICFDGLTNDAYPFVTERCFGKLTDHYEGSYDTGTFIGAFENICFLLRKRYPESKIIYICPHRMGSRSLKVQDSLQFWARQVCEKWSIPYADIYRRGGINTCIPKMRYDFTYDVPEALFGGTGTHLTAEGYRIWYAPLIEQVLKSI